MKQLKALLITFLLFSMKCAHASQILDNNVLVIEEGDNLWNIAIELYGDGYVAFDLWSLREPTNQGNPNLIHAGMRFNLSKLRRINIDS